MKRFGLLVLFFLVLTVVFMFGQESDAVAREAQINKVLSFAELPEFQIPPGKIIYVRYCVFCHGNEGKGDGLNAFSLQSRPADLQEVMANRSDKKVADVILQGGFALKKSAQMPAFANTISTRQLRLMQRYLREKIQNRP